MSSPYYRFGYQRPGHAGVSWNTGPGGVLPGAKSAVRQELSDYDAYESGLHSARAMRYPALALGQGETFQGPQAIVSAGDWPALRPSGPEPLVPGMSGLGISDTEKRYLLIGGAVLGAYLLFRKPRRRRR